MEYPQALERRIVLGLQGRTASRQEQECGDAPNRVPTRFVQEYTLRARLEASGPHEAVEGRTGHVRELGDGGLGNAQLEEAPDVVLLAVEP